MPRRRLLVVLGAVVVAAAVLAFVLLRGGDEGSPRAVGDPLAEALSYAPASSDVVVAVDADPRSQQRKALAELVRTVPVARFAADQVEGQLDQAGLHPDDLRAVLGGPVVVAGPEAAAGAALDVVRSLTPDLGPLLRAGATAAVQGRSEGDVRDVLDAAAADGRLHEQGAIGDTKLYVLSGGGGGAVSAGGGGVLARRGATLVLARDANALRRVLALHDRRGGLTRAAFESRLGPLEQPALIRAVVKPRALIGAEAKGVPWADALRDGALALRIEEPGLRLRAHLATDPSNLQASDLPLAPGAAPPQPAPGEAPAAVGVRDLSQTIDVLDAARSTLRLPLTSTFTDALNDLRRFDKPLEAIGADVDEALFDQLTGTTTFTAEGRGTIAIRAELRDGDPLRTALSRLSKIPDFAIGVTGLTDLDIDGAGRDTYEVRRDGRTFVRVAVLDDTLVATTDLAADLNAIARRAPQAASTQGALSGRLTGAYVQDQVVTRLGLPALARLVLGDIGDLTFSARAETSGVDVDAALALAQR